MVDNLMAVSDIYFSATLKSNNGYVDIGWKGGRFLSKAYRSEIGFMVFSLCATANNEFVIFKRIGFPDKEL